MIGILETLVCRILMFMWRVGPLFFWAWAEDDDEEDGEEEDQDEDGD